MAKKIGLIGYLGYSVENPIIGGQMSKTRGIYEELKKRFGEENILAVDTSNWKNEKASLIKNCIRVGNTCNTVIIMPNKNGIKIILPLMAELKKLRKYQLIYPVVGGWLTDILNAKGYLKRHFRRVDYILPETEMLKSELRAFTDKKIEVMPIFSLRKPVDAAAPYTDPVFRFCTFSRVTPAKGIDDAAEAVRRVNSEAGSTVATLDVWGPVEQGFEEHYQTLFDKLSDCVSYKGVLSGDAGIEMFSRYYMMLFPTYYPGEGFPTSVCESFMAGLPVIASDWRFNSELVKEGCTGYLFETHDIGALTETVKRAMKDREACDRMRSLTLEKSKDFIPEKACAILLDEIRFNG